MSINHIRFGSVFVPYANNEKLHKGGFPHRRSTFFEVKERVAHDNNVNLYGGVRSSAGQYVDTTTLGADERKIDKVLKTELEQAGFRNVKIGSFDALRKKFD